MQLSLAVLFLAQIANTADVCRALALSGGGSIGSYEAGAIYGLNNFGNPADYAWDSISGISAGSINALAISFFAPEDGVALSDWLVSTWRSLTNKDVYKEWPEGIILGFLLRPGMLDNSPLAKSL